MKILKSKLPKHNTAFVFQTHCSTPLIRKYFEQLLDQVEHMVDVYLLVDYSKFDHVFYKTLVDGISDDRYGVISYKLDDLFEPTYGYWDDNHKRRYNLTEIIPFLRFFEMFPNYDVLWRSEYDVFCNGDWADILNATKDSDAGYIATQVIDFNENDPYWKHWYKFHSDIPVEARVRSHNAVCRFTRPATDIMREAVTKHKGHYEVFPGSVLKACGVKIEDLGSTSTYTPTAMKGKLYDSETFGPFGNHFVAAEYTPEELKKDYLYHPVKVPKWAKWEPAYCYYVR